MKSGRRRSPVPSKKHGERGEKGVFGIIGASGAGGGGMMAGAGALLTTPHGTNTNPHLSPAASNLTLPVTPSTQSLLSVADDRPHSNLQSTTSALSGAHDSNFLPTCSGASKSLEDQTVDDDPVNELILITNTLYH